MGEVQVEAGAEETGGSRAWGLAVEGGGDAGRTAGGDGARRKGEGRGGMWRKVAVEGGGRSRGGRVPASCDACGWLWRSRNIPTSGGWLVAGAVAPLDGVVRVAESWGWSGLVRRQDPWVGALRRPDPGWGGAVAGSGGVGGAWCAHGGR